MNLSPYRFFLGIELFILVFNHLNSFSESKCSGRIPCAINFFVTQISMSSSVWSIVSLPQNGHLERYFCGVERSLDSSSLLSFIFNLYLSRFYSFPDSFFSIEDIDDEGSVCTFHTIQPIINNVLSYGIGRRF